jgi:Gpi18-like mannosyltransferase
VSAAAAAQPAPSTSGPARAWRAAVGLVLLAAILCAGVLAIPSHAASDVGHYKYWARQIATYGVAGAYSGTYPETAAIYPPVTMYGYRVAGWIYRHFFDPSFDMPVALESHALAVLVKLVAVVPHLVGSMTIFGLLLRRFGTRPALLATAAFALNPAAIFDAAYWGQPDVVHAIFLLVAIYLFEEDRPYPAYVLIGLAAATKPQAWALLPFLGYVSLRRFGLARSIVGGLVAGLAVLVVCLPYLVYGTFGELFVLPRLIAETMPVVSANAHNVWWIVTNGKPDFVLDAEPLLGSLTYRQAAAALALLVSAYGFQRTDPRGRDGELSAMAAYLAFGWFLVTTRAHENHFFFALPLLVMATPRSRFHWAMYGLLSLTLLLNMTIHDFGLEAFRLTLFEPEIWLRFQLANAGLNVVLFLVWTTSLGPRREPALEPTPAVRAAALSGPLGGSPGALRDERQRVQGRG